MLVIGIVRFAEFAVRLTECCLRIETTKGVGANSSNERELVRSGMANVRYKLCKKRAELETAPRVRAKISAIAP